MPPRDDALVSPLEERLEDVAAIRGVAMASYPASSPWVTAVGGTSLALLNATGAKQEYGWGTYNSALAGCFGREAVSCSISCPCQRTRSRIALTAVKI